jgi:hypothetical protein
MIVALQKGIRDNLRSDQALDMDSVTVHTATIKQFARFIEIPRNISNESHSARLTSFRQSQHRVRELRALRIVDPYFHLCSRCKHSAKEFLLVIG